MWKKFLPNIGVCLFAKILEFWNNMVQCKALGQGMILPKKVFFGNSHSVTHFLSRNGNFQKEIWREDKNRELALKGKLFSKTRDVLPFFLKSNILSNWKKLFPKTYCTEIFCEFFKIENFINRNFSKFNAFISNLQKSLLSCF